MSVFGSAAGDPCVLMVVAMMVAVPVALVRFHHADTTLGEQCQTQQQKAQLDDRLEDVHNVSICCDYGFRLTLLKTDSRPRFADVLVR